MYEQEARGNKDRSYGALLGCIASLLLTVDPDGINAALSSIFSL